MKIVGAMGQHRFPYWKMCMEALKENVEDIYVRVDGREPNILEELEASGLAKKIIVSREKWNSWIYKEELIRMLDDVAPDIVIMLDDDEVFENTIMNDIEQFWESDKDFMMFRYTHPMPTIDNRVIPQLVKIAYPPCAHCRVFKWKPGLTFEPYATFGVPTNYARSEHDPYLPIEIIKPYYARTRIKHYLMWTRELERKKKAELAERYGTFFHFGHMVDSPFFRDIIPAREGLQDRR